MFEGFIWICWFTVYVCQELELVMEHRLQLGEERVFLSVSLLFLCDGFLNNGKFYIWGLLWMWSLPPLLTPFPQWGSLWFQGGFVCLCCPHWHSSGPYFRKWLTGGMQGLCYCGLARLCPANRSIDRKNIQSWGSAANLPGIYARVYHLQLCDLGQVPKPLCPLLTST